LEIRILLAAPTLSQKIRGPKTAGVHRGFNHKPKKTETRLHRRARNRVRVPLSPAFSPLFGRGREPGRVFAICVPWLAFLRFDSWVSRFVPILRPCAPCKSDLSLVPLPQWP